MNTVTDITESLEHIPLDHIRVSPLHVQSLRRARFDPAALLELSTSIKNLGVAQPILVRPVLGGHVQFEIIAGERRWIAADRAGLGHIPAIVRDLSDDEVLEIQLVENLQREGLHPLEEGAGYKELMDIKRIDAQAVGQLIGKSRSYVYARTKLLDLCDDARDALQAGELDASKALLLARLGGHKLQKKALAKIAGHSTSYKQAAWVLQQNFLQPLIKAPFAATDATLTTRQHEPLPACTDCPSRSGNDSELCNALNGDEQVCTYKDCYDLKARAYWHRYRQDAVAAGTTILTGDQAAAAIGGHYAGEVNNGYLNLAAEANDITEHDTMPQREPGESEDAYDQRFEAWENLPTATAPTYRALLGDDVPGIILAEGKNGALHELLAVAEAVKQLKVKGHTPPKYWSATPQKALFNDPARAAEIAREAELQKVEIEVRTRIFNAVWTKWKGPLQRSDLERVASLVEDYNSHEEIINSLMTDGWSIPKASDTELLRFIACATFAHECESTHIKPAQLLQSAARFKIDCKAIRALTVKDLKPTAAPPAVDSDKPKAAKKKATNK